MFDSRAILSLPLQVVAGFLMWKTSRVSRTEAQLVLQRQTLKTCIAKVGAFNCNRLIDQSTSRSPHSGLTGRDTLAVPQFGTTVNKLVAFIQEAWFVVVSFSGARNWRPAVDWVVWVLMRESAIAGICTRYGASPRSNRRNSF